MFNSFKVDDNKFEELLTQKRIKALQTMMEPLAKELEHELLGNKSYKLVTNEFKFEDVFGEVKMVVYFFEK